MIRQFLRDLESAWWRFLKPEFDEPEPDETTPQVIADWIAANKHPAGCAGGCQCGRR
jgi:hypothetical protein